MQDKDRRYALIALMIDAKKSPIKVFKDIFKNLPKTVLARDMHTNNNRMQGLIDNPLGFTIEEMDKIAELIGCHPDKIYKLIRKQVRGKG
jgi:plasmid maintenance system antidote protein VapI